ncbi:uncharacterized protein LDX57_010062 [Aspergillus melleus]|uniref:uncharacterized protein n=1 Tax=Aspergillus melleus TaxID=138277 RepID=UPI001E8EE041|nr:uncharacterized protein LDX57_010062 [Aspergillus melleus]KAH8432426.1 hypothetical protein LDX57_010062 [Aspergillus melleus]
MPIRGIVKQKYQESQDEEGGAELAWVDTKNMLLQLTEEGTTTICIDAIDECAADRRTEFLDLIKSLLNDVKGTVKILLSSRPSSDLSARLSLLGCSSIDAGHNQGDIERFAQVKATECIEGMTLRGIPVSESLKEEVAKVLLASAQGMFLWIKLQSGLLSDPNQALFEEDILQNPKRLPEGLSQLYATIYRKIEHSGQRAQEIAITLFRWLLCAKASITKNDLISAISFQVTGKRDSLTEHMILDSCSNLVMPDEDLNTFRFIHTSVRDFFEDQPGFHSHERHATAAEMCLKVIYGGVPALGGSSLAQSSLQCYVILYWAFHIEQVDQQQHTDKIKDALNDLCIRDGHFQPWFKQWLPQIEPVSRILHWNDPFKDKVLQALSSPDTSFFAACAFGFNDLVQRLSRAKPELVRMKNAMGATGLHLACEYGHSKIAEALLMHGADVNAKDQYGETPLARASINGHIDLVRLLIAHGANAKIQGRRFGTPLQGAALHGHVEVIVTLLQEGVDLEAEGGQFGTALQAASLRGHIRAVKYLLAAGADVNTPGGEYETIYKAAPSKDYAHGVSKAVELVLREQGETDSEHDISREAKNEMTVELLLKQNLDMNLKETGFGPAIQAASRAGHEEVVATLLEVEGVDVNVEGGRYGSALQAAATCGNEKIVLRLLEANADINAQNGTYGTALIAACRRSHCKVAELLLQKGAAVNVQAGVYGTALQAAARSGNVHLVQLLLNHKANVNLTAGEYCTALQAAARDDFEHIIILLLQHGADVNIIGGRFGSALQAAATGGSIRSAQLLVENGAHLGDAFMIACLGGYQDIVQFLLRRGADINARSGTFGTALQAAAAGRHRSLVRFLLDQGANASRIEGQLFGTPLNLAAATGDKELMQILLQKGADPTRRGSNRAIDVSRCLFQDNEEQMVYPGQSLPLSPLRCAANAGDRDMVKMLLHAMRRSKSAAKFERARALEIASQSGYLDIIHLLIDEGVDSREMTDALRAAIHCDQKDTVQYLLNKGAQVESRELRLACWRGYKDLVMSFRGGYKPITPADGRVYLLFVASFHGHVDIVRNLLDAGEDINQVTLKYEAPLSTSSYDGTALHAALIGNHRQIFNMLLEKKADVNITNGQHGTVLQLASSSQNKDMVQLLLRHRADVNIMAGEYGTALQAAAYAGTEESVRLLLQKGAHVNLEGGQYGTALQAAAFKGHEGVVRQLIEAGADVRIQGGEPEGWEHSKARSWWNDRMQDTLSAIKQIGPQRRQSGKFGTALQAAAISGNVEIVRMLVDNGADIRDIDRYGQTPLHRAAYHGHEAVVALLLDRGAIPDHQDSNGYSSTLFAASFGFKAVLTRLFTAGAELDLQDQSGNTVLHHAAMKGHLTIVEQLITHGYDLEQKNSAGKTALHVAVEAGKCSMIRFLLDHGSNIACRGWNDFTVLHQAASSGHDAVIRILLTRGADINWRTEDGRTALHVATSSNNPEAMYLLADQGADLELKNDKGETALHLAARRLDQRTAATLLDNGANIEARDSKGQTPLLVCARCPGSKSCSLLEMIRFLVHRGANINAQTTVGETLLTVMRHHDNFASFQIQQIKQGLLDLGMIDDGQKEEEDEPYFPARR